MAQDKNAVPLQAAPSFPAWPGRVTLYAALAVLVALGLGMVLAQTWCARLFSEFGLALPARNGTDSEPAHLGRDSGSRSVGGWGW